MHFCIKIPRDASKNPIAAGNFKWILPVTAKVLNSYIGLYNDKAMTKRSSADYRLQRVEAGGSSIE